MLKLMYITNDTEVARIAAEAGVDRIFVDMEVLGKAERQKGMNTVQSNHVPEDIRRIRQTIGQTAEIVARINPLNPNSKNEIDAAAANGADIIMLPMWRTPHEAERFVSLVDGRCRTMLLLETDSAADCVLEVVKLGGIDEIHIGLNDLHLCYKQKFMFQPLADGTVERITGIVRAAGIRCGFGGVVRPGSGELPAELILAEHCRLGSEIVILSRGFCNTSLMTDTASVRAQFTAGVAEIRSLERVYSQWQPERFERSRQRVKACVAEIVARTK